MDQVTRTRAYSQVFGDPKPNKRGGVGGQERITYATRAHPPTPRHLALQPSDSHTHKPHLTFRCPATARPPAQLTSSQHQAPSIGQRLRFAITSPESARFNQPDATETEKAN
ncbi:hypothetical protein CesoFtcFv8_021394 [Champsocephalus esox]|uniref:Uncharacterized protein n=1 Tax=Champsocephalus esox TaxID=159716 RepID=A0AAN8BCV8_9TELE|nr:hypothetical protein CesoFtcFv8_021394 [Champsocephalus esox]